VCWPFSRPTPPRSRHLSRQLLQGAPASDGVGVVGAEDALADGEGAFEQQARGKRLAPITKDGCQVVESSGGLVMVRSKSSFPDAQCPLE
jgi:hypothetical protein